MKILFKGGEVDGENIDVKLDTDGYPFHFWEIRQKDGKRVVYKLKPVCWSHGALKHWEYHLL